MPRLADFIEANTEPILADWEAFARRLPLGGSMDIAALRDRAKEMLHVIAADLSAPQTSEQALHKAQGLADADAGQSPTAAQEHGAGRAESGFRVEHMMAEFRALRASVIRLWTREQQRAGPTDLADMIRFNEAIDQAIAESIATYAHEVQQSKDRFLAILGHDLRTPIGAIVMSTRFLLGVGELSEPSRELVARMDASARRMNRLVGDLLEFTRTRFGDAIPIAAAEMDAGRMADDVVSEVRSSYPSSDIVLRKSGDTHGEWDSERLAQALTNLASNAVQHGTAGMPVEIDIDGSSDALRLSVRNHGPVIAPEQMDHLFDDMKALDAPRAASDRRHLGLGLYIVERIVRAHGGTVAVQSSVEQGTVFTVCLPRRVATKRSR